MRPNLKWRIYYDDGSTVDSTESDPYTAKGLGIVCIVQYRTDGLRFVIQKFDWYYWHIPTEQWWGSDLFGVIDQFIHKPTESVALKAGRNVPDEKYSEILKQAVEDKDFLE